jgi:hypothetical protein
MRSCLIQLLVTIAVIFALLWFGLPFGASWLATNALNAAGFTGTNTRVDVQADLPPRILLGHADRIRLTSTQVSVGDLHAASIDMTLGNVELIDRKIGTIHGSMTGVRVPAATGGDPLTADSVTVDGAGAAATATLTCTSAEVKALVISQLKAQKVPATAIAFSGPDKVTVTAAGVTKTGRLVVSNGSLEVVVAGISPSTITVINAGNGNPIRFTSVAVTTTSVTLVGTIDLQSLLGI